MDEKRRAAERLAAATHEASDRARHLGEQLRAGSLVREQVELLAALGDAAAAHAVPLGPAPARPVASGSPPHAARRGLGQGLVVAPADRAICLWVDELVVRFGQPVGVRAAAAAARVVLPCWQRAHPRSSGVLRALEACESWLAQPGPERAERCARATARLGEPFGSGHKAAWSVLRACQAITTDSMAMNAAVSAVEALTEEGGARAEAEERLKAGVREVLGPWALATRDVISDPGTLRDRGRDALQSGDLVGAATYASRAVALGPNDALNWCVRAEVRRATGDVRGALEDAEGALETRPRYADPFRVRALILSDLGRDVDAIDDLEHYLGRVVVQITIGGVSRDDGPPEVGEAKALLARLRARTNQAR